ncbi:MAG: FHA domain-containing protein [Solirubrobacteraceae bacterium]
MRTGHRAPTPRRRDGVGRAPPRCAATADRDTHAEIRPRGCSWVLTDLDSTNGCVLNGQRIEGPEVIKPGDVIKLGTSVITFAGVIRCSSPSR